MRLMQIHCTTKINIKNIHEGVRYPCEQCEYSSTTARNLKSHIENKHEGVDIHVTSVNTLLLQ